MIKPINVDRAIGRNYYKQYTSQGLLLVTSVFATVQGEGPFSGHRAVFVRLGGCNYGGKGVTSPGCVWCDTYFAVDKATPMTHEQLYDEINRIHPGPSMGRKLVVVTGGEPLLQPGICDFIEKADKEFYFQIETNGTQQKYPKSVGCYVVVSPKVPQRVGTQNAGVYPPVNRATLEAANCFKFIVSADPKSPYHNVPDYVKQLHPDVPVYVSPMAVYKRPPHGVPSIWDHTLYDQRACADNTRHAFKLAQEHGYIVSLQTHLYGQMP